jgi:hypothetical protein
MSSPLPTQYVAVLVYGDHSGIQGCWGPYPDDPTAHAAVAALKHWPMTGIWSVHPLRQAVLPISTADPVAEALERLAVRFDAQAAEADGTSSVWTGNEAAAFRRAAQMAREAAAQCAGLRAAGVRIKPEVACPFCGGYVRGHQWIGAKNCSVNHSDWDTSA